MNDKEELVPMEVGPYDSERILQELLAKHPDLLAGEQIDNDSPRRWLLVTREMSVPGELGGAGRWSLDHLFLDQDGIPTLIEVKRSTDTRIRREVIGQMLDYAANAVAYWPIEEIRSQFMRRCEANDENGDEVVATWLGEDQDINAFWERVQTNLQARRVRMVFVADEIPTELRRIVEFLNEQMAPSEVLAVEIKQFVGTGVKTLVPRVMGQTETARQRKSPGVKAQIDWDEQSFMVELRRHKGELAQRVAKNLLDWITPKVTTVWWGQGSKEGGIVPIIKKGKMKYHVCRMNTQGWFAFRFDWLQHSPPFDDEAVRRELLGKINAIPGVQFTEDVISKRARIQFDSLADPTAMERLKDALNWLIGRTGSSEP